MDTDSFYFAMTEPDLDACVRPDKKEIWYTVIKPKWFVMDNSEEQRRKPGLMKIEEHIDQGSMVALSPKCYSLQGSAFEDGDSEEIEHAKFKRALKGVHKDTQE